MAAQEKPRGREALSGTSNLDERIYATMTDTDGRIQIESHAFRAGNFRFNWNEALDLTMVLKGRLKLCTEDGVFELGEDDFALINSNVGHAGLQEEFGTVVLVVLLSPSYVERLCGFMPRFGRCASFQSGGQAGGNSGQNPAGHGVTLPGPVGGRAGQCCAPHCACTCVQNDGLSDPVVWRRRAQRKGICAD